MNLSTFFFIYLRGIEGNVFRYLVSISSIDSVPDFMFIARFIMFLIDDVVICFQLMISRPNRDLVRFFPSYKHNKDFIFFSEIISSTSFQYNAISKPVGISFSLNFTIFFYPPLIFIFLFCKFVTKIYCPTGSSHSSESSLGYGEIEEPSSQKEEPPMKVHHLVWRLLMFF